MPSLYTEDIFLEKIKDKKVKPLEKYINANTPIQFQCLTCDNIFESKPVRLMRDSNFVCKECRRKNLSDIHKISLEEYKRRVKEARPDLEVIEYTEMKGPAILKCSKNHIWKINRANVATIKPKKESGGCPYCDGLLMEDCEFSIGVVRPDLIKYFINPDDAFKVRPHSCKKMDFKCPDCGAIKNIAPDTLASGGFRCNMCNDGISYPNKILRSLLKQSLQLNLIKSYQLEFYDEWTNNCSYDGMFVSLDGTKYLVEMHGMQHYEFVPMWHNEKQQDRDELKRQLAISNGFIEIEIDCKESSLNYIKQNIYDSKLYDIIDLSLIDWKEIGLECLTSLMVKAIEYYNQGETPVNISKKLLLNKHTIYNYLRRGNEISLCKYPK